MIQKGCKYIRMKIDFYLMAHETFSMKNGANTIAVKRDIFPAVPIFIS